MKRTIASLAVFACIVLAFSVRSLEAQTPAPGWALKVHATDVSTLNGGGEALAVAASGDLWVKSLQGPAGIPVQLAQVTPDGAVTIVGSFPLQNSGGSGIAVDPLTGGVVVADETLPPPPPPPCGCGPDCKVCPYGADRTSRIAMVNPRTLDVSTFFGVPWVMNPRSNGTGQEQYAFDPGNPNILYFWDSTLSKLFRLDRNTSQLRQLLALDQSTPVGQHFSTCTNDIVFDPSTGTVLLADGLSNSVLEVDPSTSPPTVTTVLSGLLLRPSRIALNPDTNEILVAGPNSIFIAPRSGDSISLVASDFTSLTDIVVGDATVGVGFSVFAVDQALNTLYEITRDSDY